MLKRLAYLFGAIFCAIISFTHIDSVKGIWIIPVSFIVGTLAFLIIFFTTSYIIGLFIDLKKDYKTHPKFYFVILNLVEGFIIDLLRMKVKVVDANIVPNDQKYLLVYNHKSLADPIILSHILRKDVLVHISKPENFKAPIAGKFIHRCGYLAINRDNDREALKTIVKSINYIKKQQYSVGVSPEGTRNKSDDYELLPFKPGMFKVATKANAPIVIATLRNTYDIHKNYPFKKTKIEVRFLKVIYPEEYADKHTIEIADEVRKIMNDDLNNNTNI